MRRIAVLVTMFAAAAVLPATAQAGVLVKTAKTCDDQALSRPFLRFLDPAQYTLAPGGAFEAGDPAWDTDGNAAVVAGNEKFQLGGADDARSLELAPGSSAQSPAMCVGIGHPTLRLVARRTGGSPLSALRVDVTVRSLLGPLTLPIGVVLGGSSWQPSLPMPMIVNLLPLLPGQMTPVTFRVTSVGSGTWDVDDVYVDPWAGR